MAKRASDKQKRKIAKSKVEVINDWGLHARPAAALSKLTRQFECSLTVHNGDKSAPALSVASLLMLEATKGTVLELVAEGNDANEAVRSITDLFEHGFGEDHKVLRGEGTKSGTVVGKAHVLLKKPDDIPHHSVAKASVKMEQGRLAKAIRGERQRVEKMVADSNSKVIAEFGDLLLAMLDEEHVSSLPQKIIAKELVNAEWALKVSLDEILDDFDKRDDPVWQSRSNEYQQVLLRLVENMAKTKRRRRASAGKSRIVVAGDIGPADVIEYHRAGYAGFASSGGSYNSHAAILARSLGFPAIVALEHHALEEVTEDMMLVVDSDASELHIKPDKAVLKKMRGKVRVEHEHKARHARRAKTPPRTTTADGKRIRILANIEFIDEVDVAMAEGAEGVGLFRTEYLFIDRDEPPGEEEQYLQYKAVVEKNNGLPVTIRTIDIGHDKVAKGANPMQESPMGLRAIRYCLREPVVFKDQLRALLRASEHGPMKILFPMICHHHEMVDALGLLQEAAHELMWDKGKVPETGVMVEIPGMIFILRQLAPISDFFSIGTNDLIQYTLAVDRNIAALAELADPCHPAVMQLLSKVINECEDTGRPVNMCGELASDPKMAALFCTLGLRELSMNVSKIAELRDSLRNINISNSKRLAKRIASSDSNDEIVSLLDKMMGAS